MFKIEFTEGEFFEIGDAIAPALNKLLASGDPENYEAKYGTATNMLSVLRKMWEERSPGNPPTWLADFESKVAELRATKMGSADAAHAIETFKAAEARLRSRLGFACDTSADADGIRSFNVQSGKS